MRVADTVAPCGTAPQARFRARAGKIGQYAGAPNFRMRR
jgi:hypothetical protein